MNQLVFITIAIDNMKGERFGLGAASNFSFFLLGIWLPIAGFYTLITNYL